VTFVDNSDGTGKLSGTPGAGTAGSYVLAFTANNGVPPNATQNPFTLTVVCPVITVSPAGPAVTDGTFGIAYSQTFTATGGTAPHTFVVTAGAVPGGLTLASGGGLTGSPPTPATSASPSLRRTRSHVLDQPPTLLIRPDAQPETFLNGVGNTQFVVGDTEPSTPHVFVSDNVLANDAGPATLSAGPASIATVNGGLVAMNTDGTFTYTPAAGFAGPSDTFSYTLTDGNGITNTAVVTINLSDVVWYVNNTYAGANGASDGRSHRPFTTVDAAETASSSGHYLFVHQGSGSTTGAAVLKSNQTLWGQGTTFTLHGLTITATGKPTLTGTITLATNATVAARRQHRREHGDQRPPAPSPR
jgi:hypothetical protein